MVALGKIGRAERALDDDPVYQIRHPSRGCNVVKGGVGNRGNALGFLCVVGIAEPGRLCGRHRHQNEEVFVARGRYVRVGG